MSFKLRTFRGLALRLSMLVAFLATLAGCTSIGPPTIPRDRFDYNAAISDSWKEQTLLNIVKLRYADMPVFVEVASVVGGYSLESSVSLGVSQAEVAGDTRALGAAGGTATYTDRPTITYAPITGQDFNISFLTPIPPEIVIFLVQSGWPADIIFGLTVDSINGLRSRVAAGGSQRAGDAGFYRTIEIMRGIQLAGGVGMQLVRGDSDEKTTLLIIHKAALDTERVAEIAELRSLLSLEPDDYEISVEYGYLPAQESEVAMITRSMLQVVTTLAGEVIVPPQDVAEGRTIPSADDDQYSSSLVKIHHADDEPDDAFVSVKYRDNWYYIDDRDFKSKITFTIVMLLMSLMESGDKTGLPLVTIPAG